MNDDEHERYINSLTPPQLKKRNRNVQERLEKMRLNSEITRLRSALAEAEKAIGVACGYMRNAKIDLETGALKKTALATISGGLKRTEESLAALRAMVKP